MPFDLLVNLLHLLPPANDLRVWSAKRAQAKFDRMFDDACAASGAERNSLLARFGEECARWAEKKPQDAHVLYKWGCALWWRATSKSGSEAGELFEQADKKFARAQQIAPNDGEVHAARAEAMRCHAALYPDEAGRRLLIQVCELCEARLGIFAKGSHDARMFNTWGLALWWMAAREKGAEALRLYQEADDKFARSCSLSPEQTEVPLNQAEARLWRSYWESDDRQRETLHEVCAQCSNLAALGAGDARMLEVWGRALCWLGAKSSGQEAEQYFEQAEAKLARLLAIDPSHQRAAIVRARAIAGRAFLRAGEERRKLLEDVRQECGRQAASNPRHDDLLEMWGNTLAWLAMAAKGAEADGLFAEAAEKYTLGMAARPDDETFVTGLAAVTFYRAGLHREEEARQIVTGSCVLIENWMRDHPQSYAPLGWWSTLLSARATLQPDEETSRLLAEANERLEAAKRAGIDPEALRRDRGTLLWAETLAEFRSAGGAKATTVQ